MNPADANFRLRIFCEAAVRGVLTAVWGVKVTGLELVPPEGALLVACNHVSLLDPPLLVSMLAPRRRPFGIGKKELFENPFLNWFFRTTGSVPVDRTGDPGSAMRWALQVLERGGAMVLFPEGTRVRPGETRPPKPGIGFLAARSGAPTVPARVVGTAEFPSRVPLEVRFGAPIPAPATEDREAAKAHARAVMDAVYSL